MDNDLPPQIENVLEVVKECIENEAYKFSEHAVIRSIERRVSYRDILFVLRNGLHEKKKTSFDLKKRTWKYAIKGKTIDKIPVRIIVAFDREMVVITIINLIRKKAVKKKTRKKHD